VLFRSAGVALTSAGFARFMSFIPLEKPAEVNATPAGRPRR
jgi:hypothetical protein